MGHWEQIGVSNRRHAARRAAMHPLRRKLTDIFENGIVYGVSILLWLLLLSPFWLWLLR